MRFYQVLPSFPGWQIDQKMLSYCLFQILRQGFGAAGLRMFAVVMLFGALACSGGALSVDTGRLTVFAASSLTEAFTDLAADFEKSNQGKSVDLNFAGSQLLRVQLENGARADVYASADQRHMDLAVESGLVSGEDIKFASNRLVIIVPKQEVPDSESDQTGCSRPNREAGSSIMSPSDLACKGVKLALAQPEVPAGRYSRTVIERMGQDSRFGPDYSRDVLANVVSEEANVRHVLQKVALGEADAGMVYFSDAQVAPNVAVILIPDEANVVASYTLALLRDSDQPELAESFINFILSPDGQATLGKYGLSPPVPRDRQTPGNN